MCGSRGHRRSRHHSGFAMMQIGSNYQEEETPILNEGLFYCLNCGQTFNSDKINFCNNCGSEIQICPISRNKFKTGDSFAQCPSCQTVFHYHHLTDWLNTNDRCPNCRGKINSILKGIIGVNYIYKS